MKVLLTAAAICAFSTAFSPGVHAQDAPKCESDHPYVYDSGPTGEASTVVRHRGAPWIQLDLSGTELGENAKLVLIGELDSQELDAGSLSSRNGWSAMFDGDSVYVELKIEPVSVGNGEVFRGPSGSLSRVVVGTVRVGLCNSDETGE